MSLRCPNINSPNFKALVAEHGINKAYALFSYGLDKDIDLNIDSPTNLNVSEELVEIGESGRRLSKLAKKLSQRTTTLNDKIRTNKKLKQAGYSFNQLNKDSDGFIFDIAINPDIIDEVVKFRKDLSDFRDETILHEVIHRYTSILFAIDDEISLPLKDLGFTSAEVTFVEEIKELYSQYLKDPNKSILQVNDDVSEFLTYGLTNAEFIEILSNRKVENTTILSKLVAILNKLFGGDISLKKTLDESFNNFIKAKSSLEQFSVQIENKFPETKDDYGDIEDFNIDNISDTNNKRRMLTSDEYSAMESEAGLVGGLITPTIQILSVNNLVNRMLTNTLETRKAAWKPTVKAFKKRLVDLITKDSRYIGEDRKKLEELNKKKKLTKLEKENKVGLTRSIKIYSRRVAVYEAIYDEVSEPDSKILKQSINKLLTLKNFTLIDKKGNLTSIDNAPNSVPEVERTNYDDNFYFTIDNRKTMSSELRLFLAKLTQKRRNDKGDIVDQTDIFEDSINLDFNLAYEELHRVLAGLDEDFKLLQKVLTTYAEASGDSKLWILNLVEVLNKAPLHIQSEFVSNMTQHYVDMKMLSFKKVKLDGYTTFELVIKNANQSALSTATIAEWNKNLRHSELMEFDSRLDDYRYTISEENEKRITDKHTDLINGRNTPDGALLASYLSEFGVILEDETIKELTKDVERYKTLLNNSIRFMQNAFILAASKEEVAFFKDISIVNQSKVREELALVNAKYTPDLFVNSYNVGENNIQAYVNNKYAINRLRDLVKQNEDNPSELVQDLNETVYTRKGYYLKELLKPVSNLRNWISLGYVGLKPLDTPSSQKQRSLSELIDNEHEFSKIGNYFMSDPNDAVEDELGFVRKAIYFYLTSSDKSVNLALTASAQVLEYNRDGEIADKYIDLIIDTVIGAEWDRMYSTRELGIDGHNKFYFFPEMNNASIDLVSGDTVTNKSYLSLAQETDSISDGVRVNLRELVRNRLNGLTKEKLDFWTANGIGVTEDNKNTKPTLFNYLPYKHAYATRTRLRGAEIDEGVYDENKTAYYMSQDMTYNYMLNLANMFQLFVGDIALYYKDSELAETNKEATESDISNADYFTTLDNLGKRMASEIAPGYSVSTHVYDELFNSSKYIQLYMNDFDTSSNPDVLKYYKEVLGIVAKEYDEKKGKPAINSTDAQEMTTWREHLTMMLASGRITEGQYNKFKKILESSNPVLSQADLNIVLNPMKPVYTGMKQYTIGDLRLQKKVYIKSSSYPLLPQLTKHLELDKLRQTMEDLEEKEGVPVRAAYGSAVKVGFPKISKNLYDINATISQDDIVLHDLDAKHEVDSEANIVYEMLDRTGLRVQQDIPHDSDKTKTTVGSQEAKLLFTDLLNIGGFEWAGEKNKKGSDLKEIYNELVQKQYEINYKNFTKEFIAKDGTIQVNKIAKLLEGELYRVGIPTISELKGLEVVNNEFVTPLWINQHSKKYSSLINALLNNNLVVRKTRGKSSVLASATGFKTLDEVSNTNKAGIINLEGYNGEELLPMRASKDSKEILPAQILVPFSFSAANKKGKKARLFLKNFLIEEKGEDGKTRYILDTEKVPVDILQGFGFRIPTQSRSSMAYVEIVGFLPENMGDIVVAPSEFIVQMGSDFDVDKLYKYFYNTTIDDEGKLHKINLVDNISDDSEFYKEALENEILNMHIAVLSNPNKEVQASILSPLNLGNLPKYKKEIGEKRLKVGLPTYLSSEYNRDKYMSGVSGQIGTATFAQATVFNALAQETGMVMYEQDGDKRYPMSIMFGNKYSGWTGNLSNVKSLRKTKARKKSEIFAGFLSAAVDNEKERLLDDLNINNVTFPIIKLLIQAGFEEDIIIPFINQDIIVDYVKKVNFDRSIMSKYDANSRERIVNELFEEYGKPNTEFTLDKEGEIDVSSDDSKLANFKGKDAERIMLDMIGDKTAFDYNNYQTAILAKYLDMNRISKIYNRALPLGNVDSKGLGKDIISSQFKLYGIRRALENKSAIQIDNIEKVLDDSISGMALKNYVSGLELFKPLYISVDQADGFDTLINEYIKGTSMNRDNVSEQTFTFLNDATKYYTLGLRSGFREYILKGEDSVLKRLRLISDDKYFKANKFLNKLDLSNDEAKKGYDGITFYAAKGNESSDNLIYMDFTSAIASNRMINGIDVSKLMEDLVFYSILDGARFSPQTFSRFIPNIYYDKMKLNQYAKLLDLKSHAEFIAEQAIQHNVSAIRSVAGKTERNKDDVLIFKPAKDAFEDGDPVRTYVKHGKPWNLLLFKLNSKGVYVWIDTLGDGKTLYEYSKDSNTTAKSVINQNKADTPQNDLLNSGTKNSSKNNKFKFLFQNTLIGDNDLFFDPLLQIEEASVKPKITTINEDSIGFESNTYVKGTDGRYRNSNGKTLDKDQEFNLRQLNLEEGDTGFPYVTKIDNIEIYVNEDGSFVDVLGNKYPADSDANKLKTKEGFKIKKALATTSRNKIGKQFDENLFYGGFVYNMDKEFLDTRIGVISKYYTAKEEGNVINSDGIEYFSYDMFFMADSNGNIFSKDDPAYAKTANLVANGGVNDVSDEADDNVDTFTPINGMDYLNELSPEDKAYMLQLANEGIIEINC